MELRVVVAVAGREHEVVVSLGQGHTVADLSAALAAHVGAAPRGLHLDTVAGSRDLDDATAVANAGIPPGGVLRWAPRTVDEPAWEAVVVGGPDAGRVHGLVTGAAVLGRSRDVDLPVSDPFVSRRHLRLDAQPDGVVVTDLGSANGTRRGGEPVGPDSPVGEEPLELGSTLVAVRPYRRPRVVAGDATATVLAGDLADAARSLAGGTTRPVRADRLVDAVASRSVPLWIGRSQAGVPVRVGWTLGEEGPRDLQVDLATGPTLVGGRGAEGAAHAVARWLAVQAAVLYPPDELSVLVAVAEDHAPDWEWAHWLPHVGPSRLLVGAGEAAAALRQRPPSPGRPLVLVDLALANADDLLAAASTLPDALVVGVGSRPDSDATGPAAVDAGRWPQRVLVDGSTGSVEVVDADGTVRGLGADGMDADVARGLARQLAPLGDRHPPSSGTSSGARRPALAEAMWAADADAIAGTWTARRPRVAVVGLAPDGPAGVDVVVEPRTAVGGAPADVADVLATMCASLAAGVGPDRVGLVVADGTGRLSALATLPHAVDVTGDAAVLVERLDTEVARRAALLDGSGTPDWQTWRRRGDVVPPPLVVVVADIAAASAEPVRAWSRRHGELDRLGIALVTGGPLDDATATVDVEADGTARVRRGDGSEVAVVVPTRTSQEDVDAGITVDALAFGRPSQTQGHTSLQRQSPVRDHLADVVAACAEAGSVAGLGRATWSPSADGFEHGRVHRTFVFTDIVGSTALVEVIGDAAWTDLVSWHDRALREAFADHRGEEVDHAGDGFLVAFENPADAVACAVAIQRRLADHRAASGFAPRVRVGGHTTEVVRRDGYKGHGLHVAARIGALADGDQVVFTAATVDQVQPRPHTVDSRMVEVKGSSTPIEVIEVEWR